MADDEKKFSKQLIGKTVVSKGNTWTDGYRTVCSISPPWYIKGQGDSIIQAWGEKDLLLY